MCARYYLRMQMHDILMYVHCDQYTEILTQFSHMIIELVQAPLLCP